MTNDPGNNFDLPPAEYENQSIPDNAEEAITVPPSESDETFSTEEAAVSIDEQPLSFSQELCEIKAAIENQLAQFVPQDSVSTASDFEGAGNIVGVGLGLSEDVSSLGCAPGEGAVNVYVAEPASVDQVKSAMVDSMGISTVSSDNIPVNVIVTGPIDALSHRFKMRPAPGGVSVGHIQVTAGTLGCLARGRRAPRNARILMLSNNHVLANSNNSRFGDSIIQPGRADGGVNPRDRVAILERFVPINFSGRRNYVDAATGWCWPNLVRRELVYLSGSTPRLFRISSQIAPCRVGMLVGKSGRTTQITTGRVTDCSATIRVNFGNGRVALFADQIAVRGLRGDFSAPGDSGSTVWTWDSRRNPVGLLFAGGGGITFANKMTRVVHALDINLYT